MFNFDEAMVAMYADTWPGWVMVLIVLCLRMWVWGKEPRSFYGERLSLRAGLIILGMVVLVMFCSTLDHRSHKARDQPAQMESDARPVPAPPQDKVQ